MNSERDKEGDQLSLNLTPESGTWVPASPFSILVELRNHGEAIEVVDLDSWSDAWAIGVAMDDSPPKWYDGLNAWASYFGPGNIDEMTQMRNLDTDEVHSQRLELGTYLTGLNTGKYRLMVRYQFGGMRVISNEVDLSVPMIKTRHLDCTINAAYENLLQHIWAYSDGEQIKTYLRSGNQFYPLGQRYVSGLAPFPAFSTLYLAQQAFAAQTYGEPVVYAIGWEVEDSSEMGVRFIDNSGKTITEFRAPRPGLIQSTMLRPLQYEDKRVIVPFLSVYPDHSMIHWLEIRPSSTAIHLNRWNLPSKAEKLDMFAANNGNIGLAWFDRSKRSILAFHDTVEGTSPAPVYLIRDLSEDEEIVYLKVKDSWGNLSVKAIVLDQKERRLKARVFSSPNTEDSEESDWVSLPESIEHTSFAFDHDPRAGFIVIMQDTHGRFYSQSTLHSSWEPFTQVPPAAEYDVSLTTEGIVLWAFHENIGLRFYQVYLGPRADILQ